MKKILFLLVLFCQTALAAGQRTITVRTAGEFIKALGPDRIIVIDSKAALNLTPEVRLMMDKGLPEYDYYKTTGNARGLGWYNNFDGEGLSVTGFANLTISGRGGATLVCEPRYADVLLFEKCNNLRIENVVMGHTMDGNCEAGVLELRACRNVKVDGCNLYGCGTEAMIVEQCLNVDVTGTEMHHCTYHTLHVGSSAHVRFKGCHFHDNKEYEQINVNGSRDVWFEDCQFTNLQGTFFAGNTEVPFYGCTFTRCRNEEAGITSLPARQISEVTGGKWIMVSGTNVNLRNAPSMRGEKQALRLEKGEYAMKLDETKEWVKIYQPESELKYAWIYKKYAPEVPLSAVPEFLRQCSTYNPVFDGKMN